MRVHTVEAAPSPSPPPVHDALDYCLKAYALFPPHDDVPLLQAVLINPGLDRGDGSLHDLGFNLKQILPCDSSDSSEAALSEVRMSALRTLERELAVTSPPLGEPMREPFGSGKQDVFVSACSLHRALAAHPRWRDASLRRRTAPRSGQSGATLTLESQKWRSYGGSSLGLFLWMHGDFLFHRILSGVYGALPSAVGVRCLLAFITMHAYSELSVHLHDVHDEDAGINETAPLGPDATIAEEEHPDYQTMGGVVGVHFVVFPIERIDERTWRFYRYTSVVDDPGSDMNKRLERAEAWARRDEGARLGSGGGRRDVNKTSDTEGGQIRGSGTVPQTPRRSSNDHYKDVSLAYNVTDYIDVDVCDLTGENGVAE